MLIGYGVLLPWQLPLKAKLPLMVSFMQWGPVPKKCDLKFLTPTLNQGRSYGGPGGGARAPPGAPHKKKCVYKIYFFIW